ncbi:MAG: DUF3800 domain-containing protein [Acidiferrobacterales bacterium]
MLIAYFDESGVHSGAQMTAISGFVATTETWTNIEREWKRQLETFRVPYFHAAECQAGKGPFSSLQRELRDILAKNLTKIICEYKPVGLGNVVVTADWETMDWTSPGAKRLRERYPNPYDLCFDASMQNIVTWSTEYANDEPVALVFAEQTQFDSWALSVFKTYKNHPDWSKRYLSLKFERPINVMPLQAADLIANQTYHHSLSFLKKQNNLSDAPIIIQEFVNAGVPLYGGYYDKESLESLISTGPNGWLSTSG